MFLRGPIKGSNAVRNTHQANLVSVAFIVLVVSLFALLPGCSQTGALPGQPASSKLVPNSGGGANPTSVRLYIADGIANTIKVLAGFDTDLSLYANSSSNWCLGVNARRTKSYMRGLFWL
jgi:hypothetical protein